MYSGCCVFFTLTFLLIDRYEAFSLKKALPSSIRYVGRHVVDDEGSGQFDWVNSGFQVRVRVCGGDNEPLRFPGGNVTVELLPYKNRFGIFLGETEQTFAHDVALDSKTLKNVSLIPAETVVRAATTNNITTAGGLLTLRKTTEDFEMKSAKLYNVYLPPGYCFGDVNSRKNHDADLRIDIYGDSDTAAFGVDGSSSRPISCLTNSEKFENFAHGWVRNAIQAITFKEKRRLDIRVQAVSGIGVYENAAGGIGTPTLNSLTMPKVLRRNLYSVDKDDYETSLRASPWIPHLVIIYLGSNDYTAHIINPTQEKFINAYSNMTQTILSFYDTLSNRSRKGPSYTSPKVLHVCGGEEIPCNYISDFVSKQGEDQSYTTTFDKGQPKGGCIGHRNTTQQATLGKKLASVIEKLIFDREI